MKKYLVGGIVVFFKESVSQVYACSKTVCSSINFCLNTLVIFYNQISRGYISGQKIIIIREHRVLRLQFGKKKKPTKVLPWFFLSINQQVDIIHPQHKISNHPKESEFLHGIQEELASGTACILQLSPSFSHCLFMSMNVCSFFTCISFLKP